MRIEPHYVVSENIQCAGFDAGVLYVRFKRGGCYSYSYAGATYTIFDSLVKAESPGGFFHRFIRNKLHHTKLTIDPFTGENIEDHRSAA